MSKINIGTIRQEAKALYLSGGYNCTETIIAIIGKHFAPDMPKQIIAIGAGFGGGISGSGCVCGTVSGGVIALGYLFGKDAKPLTKELHDRFQSKHKAACCKVLGRKEQCAEFVSDVTEISAELIARELGI